jgi:hypothetical protein
VNCLTFRVSALRTSFSIVPVLPTSESLSLSVSNTSTDPLSPASSDFSSASSDFNSSRKFHKSFVDSNADTEIRQGKSLINGPDLSNSISNNIDSKNLKDTSKTDGATDNNIVNLRNDGAKDSDNGRDKSGFQDKPEDVFEILNDEDAGDKGSVDVFETFNDKDSDVGRTGTKEKDVLSADTRKVKQFTPAIRITTQFQSTTQIHTSTATTAATTTPTTATTPTEDDFT